MPTPPKHKGRTTDPAGKPAAKPPARKKAAAPAKPKAAAKPPAKPAEKKTRGSNQVTRPDQLIVAERRRKAFALRKGGASYQEIADALGVSVSTANAYVVDVLKQLKSEVQEEAEDIKALEMMRLDQMWMALEGQIRKGDIKAIDKGIKIMERRSKFLGLDSPVKTAITNPDGTGNPLEGAATGLAALLKAVQQTGEK